MRIVSVETFPVSLPLAAPFRMSQVTIAESRNVVVKISTDDGIVGWGEGVEALDHTGRSQAEIVEAVVALTPGLVGADPLRRTALWLDMRSRAPANATAVSALDIALHDIAGKTLGVPVHELLGGAGRPAIPALTLLGSGDGEADLAVFEERYRLGYRWFKLKLGIGDVAAEAATLGAMASAHHDTVVCGDANAGWSIEEAAEFLGMVGDSRVRFVEQPTDDTAAVVALSERSTVPICVDEGARSHRDVLAFGATAIAGVSLKLIKHGGITGVMRAATLCDLVGLEINLAGKMAESSISSAANLHCAAAMSDTGFGCSPTHTALAGDLVVDPIRLVDGAFPVPTAPGLGVEVDEDRLRAPAP